MAADAARSLEDLCRAFLAQTQSELEMRFGTRGRPVDRLAFDRIVSKLKAAGFTAGHTEHMLRIQTEYFDPRTGIQKLSNVRTTIKGVGAIQAYCKTGVITEGERNEPRSSVTFEQKRAFKEQEGEPSKPVDMDEWNIRVSLQREEVLDTKDGRVRQVLSDWASVRKVFRLIHRTSFTHSSYPISVDMSVVRSSARNKRGRMLPVQTYTEARLNDQAEQFEVELEALRYQVGDATGLARAFRSVSKTVLSAIQNSNYPIPSTLQNKVAKAYYASVNGGEPSGFIRARDFIGPSSVSLELPNISEGSGAKVSVLEDYAVTDKADGLRKLLYVGDKGRIYLLDTNMNVQFSGLFTTDEWIGTIIDGEHIIHDKFGNYLDAYAAFDCYFFKGDDVRKEPLVSGDGADGRLKRLSTVVSGLNPKPVVDGTQPMRISRKAFYAGGNIFANCSKVAKAIAEGAFEYETDGLMLTPVSLGVGMDSQEGSPPNRKRTWARSFKWKPPEQNTIDFL